jgi:hypothetical protein
VAPVSCWDHNSHEAFALPLNEPSQVETNTSKTNGEFDLYLRRTRLKFEMTAIE